VGDAYLFAQLTTALEDGASSTEIDNLLVSWTPHSANQWSLAFGRFDAPIGFERDDEPLNLIPTSFVQLHLCPARQAHGVRSTTPRRHGSTCGGGRQRLGRDGGQQSRQDRARQNPVDPDPWGHARVHPVCTGPRAGRLARCKQRSLLHRASPRRDRALGEPERDPGIGIHWILASPVLPRLLSTVTSQPLATTPTRRPVTTRCSGPAPP